MSFELGFVDGVVEDGEGGAESECFDRGVEVVAGELEIVAVCCEERESE